MEQDTCLEGTVEQMRFYAPIISASLEKQGLSYRPFSAARGYVLGSIEHDGEKVGSVTALVGRPEGGKHGIDIKVRDASLLERAVAATSSLREDIGSDYQVNCYQQLF